MFLEMRRLFLPQRCDLFCPVRFSPRPFWSIQSVRYVRHRLRLPPPPNFKPSEPPPPEPELIPKPTIRHRTRQQLDLLISRVKSLPPRRTAYQAAFVAAVAFLLYSLYNFHVDPHRSLILNPLNFTPFILGSRHYVSPTSSILNLYSVPAGQNTEPVKEAWRKGIWSVQAMQPELQIARPYTPLPPSLNQGHDQYMRLLVRLEPQGEVSGMLHRISPGTLVHLRGPRIEYEIPEHVEEVLFLAGGTGISPALQAAYTIFSAREVSTERPPKMRILWANRKLEDSFNPPSQRSQTQIAPELQTSQVIAPEKGVISKPSSDRQPLAAFIQKASLAEEVESWRSRLAGKLEVDYFIDEQNSHITEGVLRKYLSAGEKADQQTDSSGKKLILISGPEGFVTLYAGPKFWKKGRESQGPLGGILQKINPQGWDVYKL